MSESDLIRSIIQRFDWVPDMHVLRLNAGLTVVQGQDGKRRAIRGVEPGTPDLMVLVQGGRVVWLEAKTARGRLSKSQKQWHDKARGLGHDVYVVRSVQDAEKAVGLEGR